MYEWDLCRKIKNFPERILWTEEFLTHNSHILRAAQNVHWTFSVNIQVSIVAYAGYVWLFSKHVNCVQYGFEKMRNLYIFRKMFFTSMLKIPP